MNDWKDLYQRHTKYLIVYIQITLTYIIVPNQNKYQLMVSLFKNFQHPK